MRKNTHICMWCFAYEFSIYVLITISGIIIFDMNNISDVLNFNTSKPTNTHTNTNNHTDYLGVNK